MRPLPKWFLTKGVPAFEDSESASFSEQTFKVYNAMNELIGEYNEFADRINEEFELFKTKYNSDIELFTTSLRQEFQDFINVVDLRIANQQVIINSMLPKYEEEVRFGDTYLEDGDNEFIMNSTNIDLVRGIKFINHTQPDKSVRAVFSYNVVDQCINTIFISHTNEFFQSLISGCGLNVDENSFIYLTHVASEFGWNEDDIIQIAYYEIDDNFKMMYEN